jgi:hypothetical protein
MNRCSLPDVKVTVSCALMPPKSRKNTSKHVSIPSPRPSFDMSFSYAPLLSSIDISSSTKCNQVLLAGFAFTCCCCCFFALPPLALAFLLPFSSLAFPSSSPSLSLPSAAASFPFSPASSLDSLPASAFSSSSYKTTPLVQSLKFTNNVIDEIRLISQKTAQPGIGPGMTKAISLRHLFVASVC